MNNCNTHPLLNVAHFNANSLEKRSSETNHFLANENIHIMSINEVKSIKTKKIYSYDTLLKLRNKNAGGGVALIIKSFLNYKQIPLPNEFEDLEIIIIELQDIIIEGENLIIATYYNPPTQKIPPSALDFIFKLSKNTLLLGDLNAHHQFWHSKKDDLNGNTIFNFMIDNNHTLVNTMDPTPTFQPTSISNYNSILDLTIASSSLFNTIINFEVTDKIHSDHLAITLSIKCPPHPNITILTKQSNSFNKTIKSIDWTEFDKQLLINTNKYDFEPTMTESDIDNTILKLTTLINESVEASTSAKIINVKLNKYLKLPKFIVNLIKKKRKLRRKFFRTQNLSVKTELNHMQETIQKEISNFKKEKWINFCNSINNLHVSDTLLWRKLRTIDDTRPPKSFSLPNLYYGDSCTNDPTITTKIFAEHLAETFQNNTGPDYDDNFKNEIEQLAPSLFSKPNEEELGQINYTNAAEVEDVIKNLKNKSAPGPDEINNSIIKRLPRPYWYIIADVCNTSLSLGYIPNAWKIANVIMIPKPMKDSKNKKSHRPISLLNSLSKVLERIVQPRIMNWVYQSRILSSYQSGFRAQHQTADHITRLIQEGLETINQNKFMGALFVDLASAFDKVWHNGLLYKLHQYKIPNYLGFWIKNYLTNRKFRIKIGQTYSTLADILAGVPQGSVLGPILFILFFNDIHSIISQRSTIGTFADDLTAWVISERTTIIRKELQLQLNSIQEWSSKWLMQVNVQKTNFLVIHRGNKNINLDLYYGNELVKYDPNPRFLGVTLDKNLLLNKHAEIITTRAQKRINMLRRIRGHDWGLDERLTMITYKVLIRSIFDYAPMAQISMADSHLKKLEVIQRKAIRMITPWPLKTRATEIYKHITPIYKLEPTKDRIYSLVDKYIGKAAQHHEVIIKLVNEYNRATPVLEGALLRRNKKPKKTILGKLKEANTTYTSPLLKPAPYPCPAELHHYHECHSTVNQTINLIFAITSIAAILLTSLSNATHRPR